MLRPTIWLFFVAVAFVTAFWFGAAGYGSYAPYAVFYSWAALGMTVWRDLGVGNALTVAGIAFLTVPIVYPTGLWFVSMQLVRRKGLKFYGVIPAVHAVGAALAATRLQHGHLATAATVPVSYLVSIAILIVFFALDYAVLARQRQSEG